MKSIHKVLTAGAALAALAVVAFAAPAAQAGEYCSVNSSGMRGCGYETLAQCQATMSGGLGTCMRDPFYKDASSAMAYQPKHVRGHKRQAEH